MYDTSLFVMAKMATVNTVLRCSNANLQSRAFKTIETERTYAAAKNDKAICNNR